MESKISVIHEFISPQEEGEILREIGKPSKIARRTEERNSITRYGSEVPYNSNIRSAEIPPYLERLCKRLVEEKLLDEKPDSVTINEYRKGQGITYHIDSEASGPIITVLSLGGDAIMGLRKGTEESKISMKRRMLLQLSGASRYEWEHCIFPVEDTRFSIIFRKGTKK